MAIQFNLFAGAAVLAALALSSGAASAQAPLLSATDHAQLATWLGQGPIALNRIFAKTDGSTSRDFHAAADGKGRTFSVMEAYNPAGQRWLVGGYNPQSWSSRGGFNMTVPDSERTAFIFNLTSSKQYLQLPQLGEGQDFGASQTLNEADFGPTFGAGLDLAVPADLTTGGTSAILSYYSPTHDGTFTSLLDGEPYQFSPNVRFGAIEVYTIAAVPEPATVAMLAAGLGVCALALRRRRGSNDDGDNGSNGGGIQPA